ncbi:hypothetical protein Ga0466249_001972 [Sporomusaceae bacterium BoRhaA]|nr:hypothetical protein [Pelorhabdus rhamnosifermentans]MBU2700867.1 hypothetical protein [Pelorhabdus rhamnosifermentans]
MSQEPGDLPFTAKISFMEKKAFRAICSKGLLFLIYADVFLSLQEEYF